MLYNNTSLGLTGYYMKFVPLFADLIKLLNKHIKQALCEEPILKYPSTDRLYMLFTDVSHYAYSGVLTQAVKSPEDLRPVAFILGLFSEM